MLFYQIGELFQGIAVGRSRKNISSLMDIRPDYANLEGDDGKTEKGNLLLPVECHEKSSFKRMVRWSRGIRGQPTR